MGAAPQRPRRAKSRRLSTRSVFAKRMALLKPGMPFSQVLRILGPPDDIRTQSDPGGISTARTKAVWCYGTNGHLTFPTLGQIYIDTGDRVQYLYGHKGQPPSEQLLPERQLRKLLRLIDSAPAIGGWSYNPRPVIRIVNTLQPLGKRRAVAAIKEYLRVASRFHSDARQGLYLVLRVLFDTPAKPGWHPAVAIGAPSPRAPKNPALLPRFPVWLRGDIPLLVVAGYLLTGLAEPVERHVAEYEKWGRLRARPLRPTAQPLALLTGMASSPKWNWQGKAAWSRRGEIMLADQLLRLIDTVHRLPVGRHGTLIGFSPGFRGRWQHERAAVTKLGIRWDPARHGYTLRNGRPLPPVRRIHYRRHVWTAPVSPGRLRLILERQTPTQVHVELRWFTGRGAATPRATVLVFSLNKAGQRTALTKFELGRIRGTLAPGRGQVTASAGKERFVIRGVGVQVPKGVTLQLDCHHDGRVTRSPTFNPDAIQATTASP